MNPQRGAIRVARKRSGTVATRRLHYGARGSRVVTVRIQAPRKTGKEEWVCRFGISGLKNGASGSAHGVDGIQALLLALEAVRLTLDRSGAIFSWLGGDNETGFPRLVPTYY